MRARFHVRGARAGFYREGTHQLCDAAPTRQLRLEAVQAVSTLAETLHAASPDSVASISISENIAGSARAAHVDLAPGARIDAGVLAVACAEAGLSGISARTAAGAYQSAGEPFVTDPLRDLTGGRVSDGELRRHAESFFQGNRFLIAVLVTAVMDAVPADGDIVDLYAGVGLFSVALAASGHLEVTAVEGDRTSGTDLRRNAQPQGPRLRAHVQGVEDYLASRRGAPARTLLVDPPRTGISKDAMEAITAYAASRIVYVSCDPPTLARDARRLLDSGYTLVSIRAFDLFPNTPHVETLAVFAAV